jgi:hypothetical protein
MPNEDGNVIPCCECGGDQIAPDSVGGGRSIAERLAFRNALIGVDARLEHPVGHALLRLAQQLRGDFDATTLTVLRIVRQLDTGTDADFRECQYRAFERGRCDTSLSGCLGFLPVENSDLRPRVCSNVGAQEARCLTIRCGRSGSFERVIQFWHSSESSGDDSRCKSQYDRDSLLPSLRSAFGAKRT